VASKKSAVAPEAKDKGFSFLSLSLGTLTIVVILGVVLLFVK